MKTSRLVIGIFSMVLSVFILFQSCAAGVVNTLEGSGEVSGSAGLLVAILFLTAGIVGVSTRKSKTGSIVSGGLYALSGLIGIANYGSYSDLLIWSILSFIFAVVFVSTGIRQKEKRLS